MKRIPISAAKHIADTYGYDQVVIYARKVGEEPEPHGEHMTTYGTTKVHCSVAARMGDVLKKFMGWDV
jgi:acetylornithine/succinyldiaminopimelate/putrescine aminotransferase